jgi:hypothetical protein
MNSPSLFEFENWTLERQSDWITLNGKYLSWKKEGEYNVYLYHIDTFFAEAWMNVRLGKIIKINCSKDRNLPPGYE